MLKQIVLTALAALALAASGALAADGPSAATGPAHIEARIAKAEKRFAAVCEVTPPKANCHALAAKIVAGMDKIEARLGKRIAKIEHKCGTTTAKGCHDAASRLEKLRELNARAEALEAKARAI